MKKTFANQVLRFFKTLDPHFQLPEDVSLLLPFKDKDVLSLMKEFYLKYYDDESARCFVLGINPGRLGAGITGISFTDPIQLEKSCGIRNSLSKIPELSSTFVYRVIDQFGGADQFYRRFFLTAVCPVGFVSNKKNINYYDAPELAGSSGEFIVETLKRQLRFGAKRKTAICLGEGKNYKFFSGINEKHGFFEKIIPLAHPRFIMQYRKKEMDSYIDHYLDAFNQAMTQKD
jgi:hypothetical protein